MQLTFFGHACFSVEMNGKTILFDPFITPNDLTKGIVDIETIKADYILVSHGHFDHVNDVEAIAKRTGATVVSNYEVYAWFEKKGLKKLHPMNTGGKWTFDFGTVKAVVAQHSSAMPDGTYGGSPMGFVIDGGEGNCFYYSGDTALTMDMQLIPRVCPTLKAAILPVGDNFTMGYEDAAIAAEFCEATKVIGVHFDTFGFIKIDHAKAVEHFKERGIELILPEIGQTIEL